MRTTLTPDIDCRGFVVRESCYPFYEPSYTELAHGCSQEVQSFKECQKEVAVRIIRA